MNKEMLPNDAELYKRVDEIAHYVWDPIGICEIPEARDEYHSYLTAIYGRVQAGKLEEIVEYMKWVESERMGLSFNKVKATKAAKAMLEWKSAIYENS